MVPSRSGWLGLLAFCLLIAGAETISKNFVNSSMPEMRPTFVVNFDMATVICQHSANSADLHLHEISVLCDGKDDCYQNPAMHDESFPYCGQFCHPLPIPMRFLLNRMPNAGERYTEQAGDG
ncbi:unnamed protein product [Nippostrongylus brasiliensis]|uniref:SVWC domain-containing protein n=1 Tax=Nippostrongylus brasiliensis TaxID=27835 RepID=A0A0N4YQC7_NIPBR|nr:unnamed protein product [Nippostrongylus brasiliensis]